MVNTEIPKTYTASPSSYSGTPYLTINHEATVNLDSSSAFEGNRSTLDLHHQALLILQRAGKALRNMVQRLSIIFTNSRCACWLENCPGRNMEGDARSGELQGLVSGGVREC